MSSVNRDPRRTAASDLERVLEPLVGYICATDHPKAALNQAFAVLSNEVAQLNRAARGQVANFARANWKK
jgi:hypothetical protein